MLPSDFVLRRITKKGLAGFWINYGVTEHIGTSHKQWLIAFAVQLVVCPFDL